MRRMSIPSSSVLPIRVTLPLSAPTFGGASTVKERGVVLSTLNVCDLHLSGLRGVGLHCHTHPCHHVGMDTSTTPYISPVIEPETMMALMLRYVEGQEEVAHQYARALVRHLTADLSVHDALRLARDIITEVTNDIRIFESEGEASRIDVALRRLIDRVEAELTD